MSEQSSENVSTRIDSGIGRITFTHPKANALTSSMLKALRRSIETLAKNRDCRVIVIQSAGSGAFSGGAFFDELNEISKPKEATKFFLAFSDLILAMKKCPKFIVARVHGKAVGGALGIIAASDYALATENAAIRLSEFGLGLGPFVVGPVIERKIGSGALSQMAIDTKWRDAAWARTRDLYCALFDSEAQLDSAVAGFANELVTRDPEVARELKVTLWEGTAHYPALLRKRANLSGKAWVKSLKKRAI